MQATPETVGSLTIVELLINPDPVIQRLAQELVRELLRDWETEKKAA